MIVSLLFRVTFMLLFVSIPVPAQAGIFSSILGDEAHAQTDNKTIYVSPSQNLQTMDLPFTRVSPVSMKEEQIYTNEEDTNIVSNALLSAKTGPMGVSSGGGIGSGDTSFEDIDVYVVRSGDTVSQVAEMFGVSMDTILSVNDMNKGDKLKEGDVLLILPFSGVEHTVAKGQTLQGIANTYKVDLNEILLANDIEKDAKLVIGEKLLIPGAGMLSGTKPKTGGSNLSSMPSIVGYFKNPVPNGKRSRGITSTHRGVDIAAPTGTPIYAAASGKVLTAKMGWNGAYGNMVILQHPNGTRTLYGHMSKLGTSTGVQVSQGDIIGYVGSTGRSTGPHLHFEVLGAKNPF